MQIIIKAIKNIGIYRDVKLTGKELARCHELV